MAANFTGRHIFYILILLSAAWFLVLFFQLGELRYKMQRHTYHCAAHRSIARNHELSSVSRPSLDPSRSQIGVGGSSVGQSVCLRHASVEGPWLESCCCLLTTKPLCHRCALPCRQTESNTGAEIAAFPSRHYYTPPSLLARREQPCDFYQHFNQYTHGQPQPCVLVSISIICSKLSVCV